MTRARALGAVERPRLMERLERAGRYKITAVVAPAGFGKTIAIRQFLDREAKATIRVEIEHDASGYESVIRAFGHALEDVVPGARKRLSEVLERAPAGVDPAALCADALVALFPSIDCVCAVDGLASPLFEDDVVRKLFVRAIEHSGENVRWIIAGRTAGGLPLASWMAYGTMDAPVGEADLTFTPVEAAVVAAASAPQRSPAQIDELYALTQGWPTAFVLALRSSERPERLRDVAASNEMIFGYLAEQVLSALEPRERDFLFATCVLPSIDLPVVSVLGPFDARDMIERVRRTLPLVARDSETSFSYQPLFRDFLEYQLRRRGDAAFAAAVIAAAAALEAVERYGPALEAYIRAGAIADVERLLETHGFELLEHGDGTHVANAIAFLRGHGMDRSPGVRALRGSLEAGYGNATRSMTLFEAALAESRTDAERGAIAYRYALELIKRNEPGEDESLARIVEVLEETRRAAILARELEPALAGTLAIAYTMLDRAPEASQRIGEALALVQSGDDPRMQALIYHQASYIACVAGDAARGLRMSSAALRLAVEQHNFGLATRICSIRFGIARGLEDDPQRAFAHLEAMFDYAERSIDRSLQREALAGMLDIEAERGDASRMREIELRIEALSESPEIQTSSVLPALALAAAWDGDFRRAHDALIGTDADQPTALRRALRLAEVGLYAAGAELREIAARAAADAAGVARGGALRNADDRRRYAQTLAWCALTYIAIGNTATANGVLAELERGRRELPARTRALVEAVRAVYLRAEIGSDEPVRAALARLHQIGHGGFARLIEALPLARSSAGSPLSLLTPAEIDVLRVLARGGSSTKVAAELQRSVNTVNVHVKSIMRKLNCATRHQAIAIAREHGLVS